MSHISFSSFKQKKEEKTEIEKQDFLVNVDLNENFTQEQMIMAWNKYIRTIQGKNLLMNTMESCKPTLTANYVLVQSVDNTYQEKEMQNEANTLVNFLRKELRNGQITLSIQLSEMTNMTKAMTPNERLKRMTENHPALKELREQFNLELDL
ncbi:MAG: hypothetical protein J6S89_00280 [Paludibacteraceae bacterium]|nr:hypothetical protein [Paludibacteraceae bacterium]